MKRTISDAQADRLKAARSKAHRGTPEGDSPAGVVITAQDRDVILSLFVDEEMSLDQLHEQWLSRYEPRQHLRWWIITVLTHLNDRSQVSIRFEGEQPLWSLIHI